MMKRLVVSVILGCATLASGSLRAQKTRVEFQSHNSYIFLAGAQRTDWGLQTVNGVGYGTFFSGIGFGIDHYHFQSYPLFFDQRLYFGNKKRVFVYGDLGYDFSGHNLPGNEVYGYKSYHFSGGAYAGGGLGARFKIDHKLFFTLSAGYSYKEISDKIAISGTCFTGGSCPVDMTTYYYSYGRWAFMAGLDL
ncbi:MAG: hypothetical protein KGM98_06515 [Bacteroidota bacterium]|nr:hypothetical protein [Bacteroidota bacterium]